MIKSPHAAIRSAEPDDAPFLHAFYDQRRPHAALLDPRREPIMPTCAELRDLLGRKEASQGQFYAIEDTTGLVLGFCSLRGMNQEAGFGEFTLLLQEGWYATPLADEALAFIANRTFAAFHLKRLVAHALRGEHAWRAFLERHHFEQAGTFREAFHGCGAYHDLLVYALYDWSPVN